MKDIDFQLIKIPVSVSVPTGKYCSSWCILYNEEINMCRVSSSSFRYEDYKRIKTPECMKASKL